MQENREHLINTTLLCEQQKHLQNSVLWKRKSGTWGSMGSSTAECSPWMSKALVQSPVPKMGWASHKVWKLTYVNTNPGRRNSKVLIIVFLLFSFLYFSPSNSWLLPLLRILVCPIGYAPQAHVISGKEKEERRVGKERTTILTRHSQLLT